ncbi:MAG: cell division protein ZapA [Gemmatimonadota bacterium]|nr:cell division protein ZapA [Gemmatimonadota bacterium]
MSAVKHAVKVTIGTEEFTVRSELPPDYTRKVAAYFDEAFGRIRESLPTVEAHKAAILAGLAITDELFQARQGDTDQADQLRQLGESLARILPPARRGGPVSGPQLILGD